MVTFIFGSILASINDIKTKIIPNTIIYPAYFLGLLECFFIEYNYYVILYSFLQGIIFTIMAYFKIFGYGDAKLGFLLGGIQINIFTLFISILCELFLSGLFALFFIKKSEKIPIAPILFIGALLIRFLL